MKRHLLFSVLPMLAVGLILGARARSLWASQQEAAILTDVLVIRDGERWTAEFTFHREAPVWMFINSALTRRGGQPWRPQSWVVETPGVRMERRQWHEVLFAEDGGAVPRTVRVRFTPFSEGLQSAYESARVFTDGSVAIYTEQFDASPLASLEEADAMPMDLNGVKLDGGAARVTMQDKAGPVLLRGERHDRAVALHARSYALFGPIPLRETEHLITVLDPGLPAWIRDELGEFTPRLMAQYAARLGGGLPVRPTVMASWTGPTPSRSSMDGDVLPGLLMMNFEGDGEAAFTLRVQAQIRSFLAHEAAHFWLGQVVRYERVRDSWITEGGADLLAVRATAALDSSYRAIDRLQEEIDECVRLATGKAIQNASERREERAYYACGATFGLLAEAATKRKGGDFFTFIRALIDANRQDEVLTRREWLDEFSRLSADPSISKDIERILNEGVDDPAMLIGSMFARVGIAHEVRGGRILLAR